MVDSGESQLRVDFQLLCDPSLGLKEQKLVSAEKISLREWFLCYLLDHGPQTAKVFIF